jgi:Xaa-Pro aminopeptidase
LSIYENPFVDLEKLRKENQRATLSTMKKEQLDAIVVTAEDSVRYLTCEKMYHQNDWWQDHYGAILTADGHFWATTSSSVYDKQLSSWEYFPFACGTLIPERWAETFKTVLQRFGLPAGARIGLDQLSFNVADELRKQLPSATFVPFMRKFLTQRAIKNEIEIKLLREAARIIDVGMQTGLIVGSTPGVRENEVFARMLAAMTEAGSELTPHNSIISSGGKSVRDFLMSDKSIKEGELFSFDIGCMVEGYHGDSGRTGFCGRRGPDAETKKLYQAIHKCQMAGIKRIRPGVRGSEIDAECRRSLRESGYPTYDAWSGHGMGAREPEYPMLGPSSEVGELNIELRPGMVFGLEVRTYKDGLGAASLEDMILVTENGCEKLTKTGYLDHLLS